MNAEIEFAVRESGRARHLRLQTRPPRTVELVVPRGLQPEIVDAFLRRHRDWIERAGRALIRACPGPLRCPATIDLRAVGETLTVRYLAADGRRRWHARDGDGLTLYSRRPDAGDHPLLLRQWLLAEGKRILEPWFEREALRCDLHPQRVQIRLQATRWGSCSSAGTVSLNAALLLVEPELVRYLFVHELAHLRHPDHSTGFWQTVARLEPDHAALDRALAQSWRSLPAWLLALQRTGRR